MEKFTLKASKREPKTPNQIRREGKVPATLYGPAVESESLQFDAHEFSRLPAAAFSHLLELDMDGKPVNVIIRNVQRVSTSDKVMNVEFYRVSLDKKLTVTVPIKFVGVSPAVKNLGAQFIESHPTVDIECYPHDIPDFIEANIATMKELDSVITFSELKIGGSIKILNPLEEIVARAVSPRQSSQDAAASTEEAAAAPEEGGEATEEAAAE